MKNKIAAFMFAAISGGIFSTVFIPTSVSAAPDCSGSNVILTIPAWYRGLAEANSSGDDCNIKSPNDVGGLGSFITTIVLNVVDMMLNVVVFIAVGFIMYGGFQYMLAQGSAQYIVGAKKTILNAVIGLVIAIVAISIVRFITGAFK